MSLFVADYEIADGVLQDDDTHLYFQELFQTDRVGLLSLLRSLLLRFEHEAWRESMSVLT